MPRGQPWHRAGASRRRLGVLSGCLLLALASSACQTEFKPPPMMGAGSGALGGGASGMVAPVGGPPAGGASGSPAPGTGVGMPGTAGAAGSTPVMPVAGGPAMQAGTTGGDATAGSAGTPDPGAAGGTATAGTMAPPVEMQTCPTTVLPPGETNETIQIGGMARSYILHVPPNYKGDKPVPFIIDWHPLLTNASFERGSSGYAQLADREGLIVAFPDGIDAAWNVGVCCTTSRTVDDIGFARGMIDTIKQRACIDAKRIYSVGYSMGGGMTLKVACDMADVFAAVAPAAFDLMEESEWPCHPARPITVIAFRGTSDFIVPYGGGASNPPNGLPITVHFLGAQGTFEKLAMLDGCTGMPAKAANGCNTYTQCMAGVEVALCTKQGGSHESGDPNVAWDVLKRFTLP